MGVLSTKRMGADPLGLNGLMGVLLSVTRIMFSLTRSASDNTVFIAKKYDLFLGGVLVCLDG